MSRIYLEITDDDEYEVKRIGGWPQGRPCGPLDDWLTFANNLVAEFGRPSSAQLHPSNAHLEREQNGTE